MHLAQLKIENFRAFGEGARTFILPMSEGLTALVGENDSGKTAVIDALRLVLGTRGQDYFRVSDSDFHSRLDRCGRGNPDIVAIRRPDQF